MTQQKCRATACGRTFSAPRPTEDEGRQDLCPACVASVEARKVEVAAASRMAARGRVRPGPRAGFHWARVRS